MIYDTIPHIDRYIGLSANLDKAIAAIRNGVYRDKPAGRYEIDGDNVYFSIQTPAYRTCGFWECHRDYIDIQISMSGDENCNYLPLERVENWSAYSSESDARTSDDTGAGIPLALNQNVFAVFFPQDAHMPCMRAKEAETGYKVVFKVRI